MPTKEEEVNQKIDQLGFDATDRKFLEAVAITIKARMEENQEKTETKYAEQTKNLIEQVKKDFEEVMVGYLTGVNKGINEFLGELLNSKDVVCLDTETKEIFKRIADDIRTKTDKLVDAETELLEAKITDLKSRRSK